LYEIDEKIEKTLIILTGQEEMKRRGIKLKKMCHMSVRRRQL
jgi:hypothetical protein